MIVSGGGKIEASDRGISEPLRTKKQEVRSRSKKKEQIEKCSNHRRGNNLPKRGKDKVSL